MDRVVAQQVAEGYGLGTVTADPAVAARGEQGRMWRVDTDRGPWAVKELLMRQVEDDAARDVSFQERMHDAGLPLPRPVRRLDGQVLIQIAFGSGDLQLRVYPWLALRRPDTPAPLDVAAALLGRLHALARPATRPMHDWFTDPLGEPEVERLEAAIDAAAPAWASLGTRILDAVRATEPVVIDARLADRPASTLLECHLDFVIDNVLTLATGAPVIVDWENAGSGTADGELLMAATDFTTRTDDAVAFVRAYRTGGGTATVDDERAFAMPLAVQGHLARFYLERALDAGATDEDRARAAWRIDELAGNLLTPGRIEELLVALRDV